jgi:hypothetical protein
LGNKYPNEGALNTDIDKTRSNFFTKSRGDGNDANNVSTSVPFRKESSAHQLLQKWSEFQAKTYLALVETVRRFNAYITPGLDGNTAATKEIQTNASNLNPAH